MLLAAERNRGWHIPDVRPVTIAAWIALLGALVPGFNKAFLGDGDTSWHIATGRWVLANGGVPDRDPFSHSMPGRAWHAHEWLGEVPMALAYDIAGWAGIAVLFMATFALILFMIGRELTRHLPARWVVAAMFALYGVLVQALLARPHIFGWAFLTVWLLILLHARERHKAPPPAAALLMVAWANMHASYVVGLGLVGVFALEALVEDRGSRWTLSQWAAFCFLALAAAFVTPHGIQGFLYPFQVSSMAALSVIAEWQPATLRDDPLFFAYVPVVGGLALLSWREVGIIRLILLAALTAMALEHGRHQALWGVVAILAILPRIAQRFTERDRPEALPKLDKRTLAVFGTGLVALGILRLTVPLVADAGPGYMGKALEAVPETLRTKPVFNEYSFGGPLILRGVKVFMDGRADMYGDRFSLEYNRIATGDVAAFRRAVQRYDLQWTILAPDIRLVQKLDREPGWKRFYADRHAIVHVRQQQGN